MIDRDGDAAVFVVRLGTALDNVPVPLNSLDGGPADREAAVLGSIDAPTGEDEIDPAAIHVRGWAYARDGVVSRVDVWLDGEWLGRAGLGRARRDVADALDEPEAVLSGFELLRPLATHPRGVSVELGVIVTLLDGRQESWPRLQVRLKAPVNTSTSTLRRSPSFGLRRPRRLRATIRALWVARALDLGGSQLRMAEVIARAHRTGGFEITVLSEHDGPLRAALEDVGASVQIAPRPPLDDVGAYEQTLGEWSAAFAGRFDLIVGATVTSFPAVELAQRLGLPSILRLGESAPLATVVGWLYGELDPAVEERARRAFAGASAIASNSHAAVRTYRAQGFDGRYTVLRTGVDVEGAEHFLAASDRADCRTQLGIGAEERLMVCAASLWKVKGQAVLVAALAQLVDTHANLTLALVGHAPDRDYVDALLTLRAVTAARPGSARPVPRGPPTVVARC